MLGCLVYFSILHIVLIVKSQITVCKCKLKCDSTFVFAVDFSLHSKAAGFLHSRKEFLIEFLVRLIGRDVYSVKTCVSLG